MQNHLGPHNHLAGPSSGQMDLETAIRIQTREIQDRIAAESYRNRPVNTTKTYGQKQKEFIAWCREHNLYSTHPFPELVSADKLLLFLESQDNRFSRRAGESTRTIGIKTYDKIVSSIIDLWKQQVRIHNATHRIRLQRT
jgi:hypothetical protein